MKTNWANMDVDKYHDVSWEAADKDKRGAIVAKCAAGGNKVCTKAVEIFSQCYGSEAGVAALKWLPYGGLYISGGIAAKNPEWVTGETFMAAYKDKGRMSTLQLWTTSYTRRCSTSAPPMRPR